MAWLKLTHLDGRKARLNTDQISEISDRSGSPQAAIWSGGRLFFFRESVEEIAAMIEQAERAEMVTRFAVAIVQCESDTGAELVWQWAAEYVDVKPLS